MPGVWANAECMGELFFELPGVWANAEWMGESLSKCRGSGQMPNVWVNCFSNCRGVWANAEWMGESFSEYLENTWRIP